MTEKHASKSTVLTIHILNKIETAKKRIKVKSTKEFIRFAILHFVNKRELRESLNASYRQRANAKKMPISVLLSPEYIKLLEKEKNDSENQDLKDSILIRECVIAVLATMKL